MPPFRKPNKLLTCFYCGRRSSTRYDGHMQCFDCNNCKATNYLDATGKITDPPVATTATPDAPIYARRSASPPPAREQVFCNKCLNNQHLFISSLAQYLPDDPDDPDYAERERNYYKFRRGLEKRYPQVCATCEPKVRDELDKAAYTAKTDHLRRMIDRTAQTRVLLTKSTARNFQALGEWLWLFSFLLQLLWHVSLIHQAILVKGYDNDGKSWTMLAARIFGCLVAPLPAPHQIMNWSFWTSVLGIWWNPRWVETSNGFTKHLIGISNFYAFQALIVVLKLPGFLNISVLPRPETSQANVYLVAHTFMSFFMFFVYKTARGTIQVNHAPLWAPKPTSIDAQPSSSPPEEVPGSRDGGEQTMADILDEILNEPTATPGPSTDALRAQFSTPDNFDHLPRKSSYNPSTPLLNSNPFRTPATGTPATHQYNLRTRTTNTGFGLDSLSISDRPPSRARQPIHYDVEMDWSPTQSQHRAFNTHQTSQSQRKRFNETPVQERSKTFWARIPPAPTTPAQRIFNPPNVPRIRTSPATPIPGISFQGSKTGQNFRQSQHLASPETIFANPKFITKPPNDERDTLSDLFKGSFTLGTNTQQDATPGQTLARSGHTSQIVQSLVLGLCLAVLANRAYNYFL